MHVFINLVSILFVITIGCAQAQSLQLTYFQTGERYEYHIELLRRTLDATVDEQGGYTLSPIERPVTFARGLMMLEEGKTVNIGFFATSRDRETRFTPVDFPILNGLLGFRVFYIRQEDRAAFAAIESLEDLKSRFTAGFGSQWADMKILNINGIPVIGSANYDSLFQMLSRGRFDYFPRGVSEAWNELPRIRKDFPNLEIESRIALYYPYPVYFFVHKDNLKLARRISEGLQILLDTGEFEELFFEYHDDIIRKADLQSRRLLVLDNPTLPETGLNPDAIIQNYKKL